MKKKGLIVATIVMVLVLAVSLTTATYAWFTTDSKATISSISIATTSASDVQVGLRASGNGDIWGAAPNAAQFKSGQVSFNGLAVTGGQDTVGATITTSLTLAGLTQAIGTAAKSGAGTQESPIVYDVDDTTFDLTTSGHVLVAANGSLTTPDNNSVKEAEANSKPNPNAELADLQGDYVDWVIGFMPTKDTIDTVTFNVTVKAGAKVTLGLLSALHLRYSWDGTNYYDVDLYGTSNHQATLRSSVTSTGLPSTNSTFAKINGGEGKIKLTAATTVTQSQTTLGTSNNVAGMIAGINDSTPITAGSLNYAITIGTVGQALGANLINQMHFQLFYAGYDGDCVNDGLGADATIIFTITNTTFGD